MNAVDGHALPGDDSRPAGAAGTIRQAKPEDIALLMCIEEASFDADRLSRRSFRHLLTEGNSVTLLDETEGVARGYVTLLFRAHVALARVYSIATAPGWLGQGVASRLLAAAEELALARHCVAMRLEIRRDNLASQKLFLGHGYALFGEHAGYYEDGMDALRFEKSLTARLRPELARIAITARPSALPAAPRA